MACHTLHSDGNSIFDSRTSALGSSLVASAFFVDRDYGSFFVASCATVCILTIKRLTLLVACWSFVYLLQGPVYYYLQVCVIIILWGVEMKHPWRSLIAVLVASFWAGMSGVNWYPVPAALAAALYLLEQPVSESKNIWQYLVKPLLWGVFGLDQRVCGSGILYFYFGQQRYKSISFQFDFFAIVGSFASQPGISAWNFAGDHFDFASIVAWTLVCSARKIESPAFDSLILLGLILLVLFLGCLVVSVKIGGGADLHDMDSYEVLLQIIAVYFFANQVRPESGSAEWGMIPWPVLVLVIIIPFVFPLDYVGNWVNL